MNISKTIQVVAGALAMSFALAGFANAGEPDLKEPRVKEYIVGAKWSGYVINENETRDMQDDDFQNPVFSGSNRLRISGPR